MGVAGLGSTTVRCNGVLPSNESGCDVQIGDDVPLPEGFELAMRDEKGAQRAKLLAIPMSAASSDLQQLRPAELSGTAHPHLTARPEFEGPASDAVGVFEVEGAVAFGVVDGLEAGGKRAGDIHRRVAVLRDLRHPPRVFRQVMETGLGPQPPPTFECSERDVADP